MPIGFDNQDSDYIKGATDDTLIGNLGNRLLVDSQTSEKELATFAVLATDIAPGNGKSMLSLVNTSGSTVTIRIREIRIINTQTVAVTGVINIFDLLRITNHSAGTALTPGAYDTSDSLDGSVTARTGSTVSGEVAGPLRRWKWSSDEHGVGSQDVESTDAALQNLIPAYTPINKTKPITLRANEGIHIKQTVNTAVGTFDLLILFTQE